MIKASFVIYADLECLIEKTDGCKNNPENSFTTKIGGDIRLGFSISTISLLKTIKKKNNIYRGKDCLSKFSECLGEHTMEIINFQKIK